MAELQKWIYVWSLFCNTNIQKDIKPNIKRTTPCILGGGRLQHPPSRVSHLSISAITTSTTKKHPCIIGRRPQAHFGSLWFTLAASPMRVATLVPSPSTDCHIIANDIRLLFGLCPPAEQDQCELPLLAILARTDGCIIAGGVHFHSGSINFTGQTKCELPLLSP